MEKEQQLKEIQEACMTANSGIKQPHNCGSAYCGISPKCFEDDIRPIRLADVLLAIGAKNKDDFLYYCNQDGVFAQIDGHARATWNLRQDDLTQQSPECIAFIHSLLK